MEERRREKEKNKDSGRERGGGESTERDQTFSVLSEEQVHRLSSTRTMLWIMFLWASISLVTVKVFMSTISSILSVPTITYLFQSHSSFLFSCSLFSPPPPLSPSPPLLSPYPPPLSPSLPPSPLLSPSPLSLLSPSSVSIISLLNKKKEKEE